MNHPHSNKIALFLLMFNMFITMAGIGVIIPVMPDYLKQFGAAGQILGLLIATFAFAQFVFSPLAGNLSDKYGRKNLIIFGLVVYGLSQIFFGLSTEIWMLFIARLFSGLGAAFIMPPIMAFVADVTTYEERGKGMGLLGASISFGFMIGPAIGGFLSTISLQFPFYLGGTVAIIAAMISLILLPQKKQSPKQENATQHIGRQMIASLRTPYFVMLLVVLLFSFGIANFQTTLPLFVTQKFHYTPSDIAVILTVAGFVGVLVQIFAVNRLFKRFGEMKVILVNIIVAASTLLVIIYVDGYFVMLLLTTIFSTATTLIRPAINTLISKLANDHQGFAAGLNNAYMSLGNMIGPAIAGITFDINQNIPYYLGAFILTACFILAFLWAQIKAPHLMKTDVNKPSV